MKGTPLAAAAACLTGLGAIQLLPFGESRNPPVTPDHAIETAIELPDRVEAIMSKACRDCHSNETRWPWYSRIAPASWVVGGDVESGRRAMNLSEWTAQAGRRSATALTVLTAACTGVRTGRMPPKPYLVMHPEARLSPAEIESFCQWTSTEARRLKAGITMASYQVTEPLP